MLHTIDSEDLIKSPLAKNKEKNAIGIQELESLGSGVDSGLRNMLTVAIFMNRWNCG